MSNRLFRAMVATQATGFVGPRLRRRLLRSIGLKIADDAIIFSGAFFGSRAASIADGCFVSVGCFFDGSAQIELERNAHLGPGVRLITSTHLLGSPGLRAGKLVVAPIFVGEGAWIGAGVTILPGVSIAPGCVVGAGALVTRDTTPNAIWHGHPAREIRLLDP